MSVNIKSTNLRFNLNKDLQRQAWEYLQTMDKQVFKSYSHAITLAVISYFEHYYKTQDDPYLETRQREEQFVEQIVSAVQAALERSIPLFLAGCVAGQAVRPSGSEPPQTETPEPEVDWDYLGG